MNDILYSLALCSFLMPQDKRFLYNWLMVILTNAITITLAYLLDPYLLDPYLLGLHLLGLHRGSDILLFISLVITIVPILISQSYSKHKLRNALCFVGVFLLPLPYLIYITMICVGKLCGIELLFFLYVFAFAATGFAIFYAVGTISRRIGSKSVLILSLSVPILYLVLIYYSMF